MTRKTLAAIGCCGFLLAACGGGGSGDLGTPPNAGGGSTGPTASTGSTSGVPSSALAGVDAFIAYVRTLAADETSEPLALPDVAAPKSDTLEPAA